MTKKKKTEENQGTCSFSLPLSAVADQVLVQPTPWWEPSSPSIEECRAAIAQRAREKREA